MIRKAICTTLVFCTAILGWSGCDEEKDPSTDYLGGETNTPLSAVGAEYDAWFDADTDIPELMNYTDSTIVTRNDGGNVTLHSILRFDTSFVHGVIRALGMGDVPSSLTRTLFDHYAKRVSATVDTADPNNIVVTADVKLRITSEGIQDYVTSAGEMSKPFTIVKYNANVGDTWETTDVDGVSVKRTVTYKSTTDDYDIAFWRIKVIKVEETKADPLIEKITYVANHKYGLVGILVRTKQGKELQIGVWPPNL
jgi:hypothetical protein